MKIFINFMKTKVLFLVAFFAIAISASAQFNVGVKAGFNASTIANIDDSKYRPGFHVGLMAQYMVTENFGLESGLYYTTLGVNVEYTDLVEAKMNPSYLQLPITALYKFQVGEGLSLYPSAGLYLGYGLSGKYKFISKLVPSESEEFDFFGKEDGEEWSNRFDAGATVGLNLQFNKFIIGLGYDYGFLKINKESGDDGNLFNGNIKVSVGYIF